MKRALRLGAAALVLLGMGLACSLPGAALQPAPTQSAAVLPPTSAPSAPAQTIPPSPAPLPTRTPLPAQPVRLIMDPGSTDITVEGLLHSGETREYLAGARRGDWMMLMLHTTGRGLEMQFIAPGGKTLTDAAQSRDFWQGALPEDGDYRITLSNPGPDTNFAFGVIIPVRISFPAGGVSAELRGLVGQNRVNSYLLRATQGQTMSVVIDSPRQEVLLTIYGVEDGNPYVRSVSGATQFTFTLPATQDYMIECVNTAPGAAEYVLRAEVQ